jgi:hypothetical protein
VDSVEGFINPEKGREDRGWDSRGRSRWMRGGEEE